ncbi:MAG TPA: hypothetical protein VMR31_06305 [Myxococcota bacterium]|nr:hypothetical protein [Myxococcota bacterium]
MKLGPKLAKLFVKQYSVEYSAFSRAAVAAPILGKVVPLLDWANAPCAFGRPRRIVSVCVKTIVYALVVIVLGTAERLVDAYLHEGSIAAAFRYVAAHAELDRFLGLVILLSLVVAAYLTIQELDGALGKGAAGKSAPSS